MLLRGRRTIKTAYELHARIVFDIAGWPKEGHVLAYQLAVYNLKLPKAV